MSLSYSKAWLQFLADVDNARNEIGFGPNEECFYRGHTQESYKLLPGLYRGLKKNAQRIPDALWEAESDLFYEFRSKAKELHDQNLSDWDILFFMQHHGVRTRLLDWTESLAVAVYFALLDYDPATSKPCIWIMNPYKFNQRYHTSRDLWDPRLLNFYEDYEEEGESYEDLILYNNNGEIMPWDEPIALYPVRRANRLVTQSGYFTIHGNDSRPIEEIVSRDKKMLQQVPIRREAVRSAFAFLEHAGINRFTLFPDLDGLSRHLNYQYFAASDFKTMLNSL
ncbi:MAG TPA: FRG domain-containing protein [Ferruginibacter sp.]|nr:FRG domain-containing protein [Ferruginibacter sp.]HMW26403.1 FRG domain-containing protein [Ferruginibacter sp.]HMX37050.1 FRG domain-containing protein [Ferruginibacter sp.]HNA01625.1 FRG domain-containing protein [Ferruginibacter sp.]HNF03183.1 FRG domain-containing protein [Ferruginibacter sp.]